jgi:hypothetical protein
VRKIVEVQEIADADLKEGTEIYSAFIDREWADVLMTAARVPLLNGKSKTRERTPTTLRCRKSPTPGITATARDLAL